MNRGGASDKRGVTLRDVAKAANVSITTASRALAGYPDVSPRTRARVRQIAQQLGYTPDFIAQNLVRREPTLVGVYIDDQGIPLAEQPFFLPVLCGVRDQAAELGQHVLLLARRPGSPSAPERIEAVIKGTRIAGLIVMGLTDDHPYLDELERLGVPTVTIDITPRGRRMVMVTSDNTAQAAAVTSHLIEQGCRRILFVGGQPNTAVHPRESRAIATPCAGTGCPPQRRGWSTATSAGSKRTPPCGPPGGRRPLTRCSPPAI